MAIVQIIEMNKTINGIVGAVRKKAQEIGIKNGVVAVCYNNNRGYDDPRSEKKCFPDLLDGESSVRVFSLNEDGSTSPAECTMLKIDNDSGFLVSMIAMAAKACRLSKGKEFTSRGAHSPDGYGGCVAFPLTINHNHCGNIYVAVTGGNERENEVCAWEAYNRIVKGLVACKTTNPGPLKYGIPEL